MDHFYARRNHPAICRKNEILHVDKLSVFSTPRQMELANGLCRYAEMSEIVAFGAQVPVALGKGPFSQI